MKLNWFAFALLISAFGVGYALGYYNTDKITPLSNTSFILQRDGVSHYCVRSAFCEALPTPNEWDPSHTWSQPNPNAPD